MSRVFSRLDQSVFGRWWWTVDRAMLTAFLTLMISGVVLVAAASPPVAERIGLEPFYFLKRHLVMLVPALAIMMGVSLMSPRNIWRMASLAFLASVGASILVLIFGMEIKGAQRWLHLPGFSLQPSEFLKVTFAVMAAWLVAQHKSKADFPGNQAATVLFLVVCGLLLLQPDFGMTVVVSTVFGIQIFLAGFPIWIVCVLMGIGVAGLISAYFVFDHVQSRIDRFLDPSAGDNFQVQKSLEAFQNGGVFGTGPGQGEVKLALPDAHADFIFSVAGEEMGLIFVAVLVTLYGFVILRGMNRIMDSSDMFKVLAVSGLLAIFGLQALIHMGSSLQLLPAKGMTLPFISYGGSSLLAMSLAMGMVLALTRRQVRSGVAHGGSLIKRNAY